MRTGALIGAALAAVLLSGPGLADDDRDRRGTDRNRADHYDQRDRYTRAPPRYRPQRAYRDGYAAGYRAAQRRCSNGYRYRQHSWQHAPRGDWLFSAGLENADWRAAPLAVVASR